MGERQYARVPTTAGIIAILLAGCASGPTMQPQLAAVKAGDCSALLGVNSEMATITSATPVAAAETIGTTKVTAPFCRVQGVARPSTDSLINFEVLATCGKCLERQTQDGRHRRLRWRHASRANGRGPRDRLRRRWQ